MNDMILLMIMNNSNECDNDVIIMKIMYEIIMIIIMIIIVMKLILMKIMIIMNKW